MKQINPEKISYIFSKKGFFIFCKMELSDLKIKTFLLFSDISVNGTFLEKASYTSRNGTF